MIDSLAPALQLDEAERAHREDPAPHPGSARPPRRRPTRQRVRPTVQRLLDSITGASAFVLNGRLDVPATNELGIALYSPIYAHPARPANTATFVFLDPHATDFFRDHDKAANDTVALLRAESRPRPLRPGPLGPDRTALHPQRRVPPLLDRAQRPHPHQRCQTPPPSRCRRPRPGLRVLPPARRPRPEPPHPHHLEKHIAVLMPGREIVRHGPPEGNFTFADGTEFSAMSRRAERERQGPRRYRVVRALHPLAGKTAPWHDQPGGGQAYYLPRSVEAHVANGSLTEL